MEDFRSDSKTFHIENDQRGIERKIRAIESVIDLAFRTLVFEGCGLLGSSRFQVFQVFYSKFFVYLNCQTLNSIGPGSFSIRLIILPCHLQIFPSLRRCLGFTTWRRVVRLE